MPLWQNQTASAQVLPRLIIGCGIFPRGPAVQADPNVLIAGIIVTGNAPKNVIIRASGPSLSVNGAPVPGRLTDPTLELYVSGSDIPIAGNDDWRETQRNEIIATGPRAEQRLGSGHRTLA